LDGEALEPSVSSPDTASAFAGLATRHLKTGRHRSNGPTSSTRYTGSNGVNQYTTTVTDYDARNRPTGTN